MVNSGASALWARMPAAETFFMNTTGYVQTADLTGYTQVRLHVNRLAGGVVGATFVLRYSPFFGPLAGNYLNLSNTAGQDVAIDVSGANNLYVSNWFTIPTAARTAVFLAPITRGGDLRTDITFGNIVAEFR